MQFSSPLFAFPKTYSLSAENQALPKNIFYSKCCKKINSFLYLSGRVGPNLICVLNI